MAKFRTTTLALALSAAVLLAGCSDASSPSDPGSTSPAATPDVAVAWANAVCSASTELRTTVQQADQAFAAGLSASPTSLEQAKAEVKTQVDAVQQAAASLARTLTGVPVGAGDLSVLTELQTAAAGARAAAEKLRTDAAQVADAQSAAEFKSALTTLKSTLAASVTAVKTYLAHLRDTVGPGEQAARTSFGAAPACQGLTASTTASP